MVVQAAERAGDIGALGLFDLEHKFADIGRYRVHPEGVKPPFKHMGLDAGLMERGRPHSNGTVGILAVEEIDLLECAAVGLDSVEASHVYNGGGHADKLVSPGLIFAGRLPHIAVNERKFYFSTHSVFKNSNHKYNNICRILKKW